MKTTEQKSPLKRKQNNMTEVENRAIERPNQQNLEEQLADDILMMMATNFDRQLPDADRGTAEAMVNHAKPVAQGIAKKLVESMSRDAGDMTKQRWKQLVDGAIRNAFVEFPDGSLIQVGQNPSFATAVANCTAKTVAPAGSDWGESMTLTKKNWQEAVLKAAMTIRRRVPHIKLGTKANRNSMRIFIRERWPEGEPRSCGLQLKYWRSVRDCGWPKEFDDMYAPGGRHAHTLDWPVVTVCGMTSRVEIGCYVGRASTQDLQRQIEKLLLMDLFEEGLISEDCEGDSLCVDPYILL